MKKAFIVLGILSCALIFIGCTKKEAMKEEVSIKPVSVESARNESILQYFEIGGEVKGDLEVLVFPEAIEKIERIFVEIGDSVQKGDKLALLKEGTLTDSNKQALAGLDGVRVNSENADKELERVTALFNAGLASISQLNQAKTFSMNLKAQLKQLEAQVNQTDTMKQKSTIVAPISGFIGTINYNEGDMAQPQRPFCTITRFDSVKIISRVPDIDMDHIKVGQSVIATVESKKSFEAMGKITKISPVVDPISRTFEVQSTFLNNGYRLRPGMLSSLKIEISKSRNAILIPSKSIVERLDDIKGRIFIVNNNKAVERVIRLGQKNKNYIEVIDGVKSGDQIVVSGEHLLKDGDVVKIVK